MVQRELHGRLTSQFRLSTKITGHSLNSASFSEYNDMLGIVFQI